ncbi:MAG: potassium transporter KefB [Inquilinus sp.]|nr:potassium transporter KefB [Inquilinus sp.]
MKQTVPLNDVLVLLAAAIVFVPIFQRFKISPVLGYLVAGVVVGPGVLSLVGSTEEARLIAEFGVVFLLFAVGLELPLARLRAMRRYLFGLGLVQVAGSSLVIALLALAFGTSPPAALVIGGALALSSTATVLQLLVERSEVSARHGRVAIGVLLFQDLAVVPLLVLLPLLAGGGGSLVGVLGVAGMKAAVAMLVILVIGRFVVRPVYRVVAGTRNAELFAATSVFVVLATGWVTAQAGMSMALGAFLAGLMLAESEYRHQIEADIQPFRGLLLGLFFMAIGMTVDLGVLADRAEAVFAVAFALMAGKALLIAGLGLAFGLGTALSVRIALLLAQGGEFAFVIVGLAVVLGIVADGTGQILFLAVAVSLAATPLLAWAGSTFARHWERRAATPMSLARETDDVSRHVIIAGFGRVGETIARMLASHEIPYIAVDRDAAKVGDCHARGLPVYFGNARQPGVFRSAGAGRARAVAITLDKPGLAERVVTALHAEQPELDIVARGRDFADLPRLEKAGATAVVPEALEGSLQLGAKVLRQLGVPAEEVERTLEEFRRDDYAALRADEMPPPTTLRDIP